MSTRSAAAPDRRPLRDIAPAIHPATAAGLPRLPPSHVDDIVHPASPQLQRMIVRELQMTRCRCGRVSTASSWPAPFIAIFWPGLSHPPASFQWCACRNACAPIGSQWFPWHWYSARRIPVTRARTQAAGPAAGSRQAGEVGQLFIGSGPTSWPVANLTGNRQGQMAARSDATASLSGEPQLGRRPTDLNKWRGWSS
jgi:hypothetical protein